MKKYKVLFFGAGKMGELVLGVLKGLENVEVVDSVTIIEGERIGKFDLIFSASYPGRISQDLVKLTALGAVNLHTGLLPEGRGSHPLNWALIWGKKYTGITIHKIVDTYDAGDICVQIQTLIDPLWNIIDLRKRIEEDVPAIIDIFFTDPEKFLNEAQKQDQSKMSYAQKRRVEDSELNLDAKPKDIYNLFRSCHPVEYPAFVIENGKKRIVKNVNLDGTITYED